MTASADNDQTHAWTRAPNLNKLSIPKEDVDDYPVKPLFDDHVNTPYRYRGGDASMFSSPVLMIAGGLMFVLIVFKRGYMDGRD